MVYQCGGYQADLQYYLTTYPYGYRELQRKGQYIFSRIEMTRNRRRHSIFEYLLQYG